MSANAYTSAAGSLARPIEGWSLVAILRRLSAWREAARQRQALARLAPEHLRDIGLEDAAAAAEMSRQAWRVPTLPG